MIALVANKSIMRLKLPNNAFFEFLCHDLFVSHKNDHEFKISKNDFLGFDLMINLLVTQRIMRSKFANDAF